MAGTQGFMLVLISVGILSLADSKEANVTCVIQDDCILPCSFRPTGTVVIHWYKQQIPVHSYYYNKDQFGLQNKHFSGRTCLFNSQIPHGNASLLLKRVKVQDKGRYKCYTSTKKGNHENFINLEVKALIQSVNIEITAEMVFCSSQYIYPVPQVAWATDPPPTEQVLNSTTRTIDHKGLFTVESSLRILGNRSDHTYICTFTSADKTQVWIASRKNQEEIRNEEGHKFSIPCIAPHNLSNFTLTWTFSTSSEPAVIYRYDSRTRHTFNLWEGQAELDQDLVLEGDGSLWLLDPEVQEHTGTYTCTFSALQSRRTIQTNVNITVALISEDERSVGRSWWSTVASVGFVVFTVSVAHCRCLSQRAKVNRAVSRRHNGATVTCSGTQESFNATASRITGPHSADAIMPQTHLQTQDVLEADMPETEENGSLKPHSEMSTDQEEHIRPVNHEHQIEDGALGSAEFRLHIVPGTCAQDLEEVKLTDCENMHGQECIV